MRMSEFVGCLSPTIRRLLDEAAQRVREHSKRTVESVITIGRELQMCRQALGSGEAFDAWIEEEFAWSRRTAYKFMQLAERGAQYARPEFTLDLSALYLLARPSTPQSIHDRALAHAVSGKHVRHRQVREWMKFDDDRTETERENGKVTRELIDKLRSVDEATKDPAEVARRVSVHLRPLLAERVQELGDQLFQLAAALKGVGSGDVSFDR
jgi:hypothetical protein